MSDPLVFQKSSWLCTVLYVVIFVYIEVLFICPISADQNEYTYTNEMAVHIEGGEHIAHEIAKRHGFINKGQIGSLRDHYLFEHSRIKKRSAFHSEEHHARLHGERQVIWFEQQYVKSRRKRDLTDISDQLDPSPPELDPRWKNMWYLKRKNGLVPNMNVVPAWNAGYSGKGVVVTILDDGIESNHTDLIANYDPQASFDVNANDSDPFPRYDFTNENKHGTRCAGEVAAMRNHVCGVGIAFNAKIGGIRMLDGPVTDRVEAASIGHNPQHIDIYSASWGPDDDGKTVDGPGTLTKKVFEAGIKEGRRGLGSIFVWASGNGGRHYDSCNCDGYTNSIYTLSVSSATEHLRKPWYLEECSSTLATTYSSGSYSDKQIITTDLHNMCTDRHTGTSASAPMAAGIVALVLEANPKLTWRDVQYITLRNARPFSDGVWLTNGRGRKVSLRYGYGLMDTSAMVRDAEHWVKVPDAVICNVQSPATNVHLSEKYTEKLDTSSSCSGSKAIKYVEHVQAWISLKYHYRGNVQITLRSPAGTESVLLVPRRSDTKDEFKNWPFMSVHFWGEEARGVWTLSLTAVGTSGSKYGTLKAWALMIHGTLTDPEEGQRYNAGQTTLTPMTCHSECGSSGCTGPSAKDCTSCLHYKMSDTTECVAQCSSKGFYSDSAKLCIKCNGGCLECDSTQCVKCVAGLYRFMGSKLCLSECTIGYYKDVSRRLCRKCSFNCRTCNATATSCTSCVEGNELSGTDCMGSKQCRDHEYKTDSGSCESCHVVCGECSGPGVNECTSCTNNAYLRDGSCMRFCSDGTYSSIAHPTSNSDPLENCKSCHASCHLCDGPSERDCISCTGMKVLTNGVCKPVKISCDSGEYKDETDYVCKPCATNCASCSGSLPTQCTTCLSSTVLQSNQCLSSCEDGFYETISTLPDGATVRECATCHHSCATCHGMRDTDCVMCTFGANKKGQQCVMKCDSGSYMSGSGVCEPCHVSCGECVTAAQCTECRHAHYLINNTCVPYCPHEYFVSDARCVPCSKGCSTCTSQHKCTVCRNRWILSDFKCHLPPPSSCPDKTYYNHSTAKCQTCHKTCAICSGHRDTDCLSCDTPYTYHSTSKLCLSCCHGDDTPVESCCECNEHESCLEVIRIGVPHTTTVSTSVILALGVAAGSILAIFILVFLILQLRSHKWFCLGHRYNKLPVDSVIEHPDSLKLTMYHDDVETNGFTNGTAYIDST